MTRTLTAPELNRRIAGKAAEVKAIADRARAQGKGPHREIGHSQQAVLSVLQARGALSPLDIAAACCSRTCDIIYPMAALCVRGEIEVLDTGLWRLALPERGRARA